MTIGRKYTISQVMFTDLAYSPPESVPLSRVVFQIKSVLFGSAISIDSADKPPRDLKLPLVAVLIKSV